MIDNADNAGQDDGSGDASSNNAIDAAAKDADSGMSFDPVGDGTVTCPSNASPPPATKVSPEKKHWITIELVDEDGEPVPGEDYRITLPDGSVVEGSLDSNGKDRIEGIDAGNCKVTFPNLDKETWESK